LNSGKLALILLVVLLSGIGLDACGSNSDTQKTGIICGVTFAVVGLMAIATTLGAGEADPAIAGAAAEAENGITPMSFVGVVPKCVEYVYDVVTSSGTDSQATTANTSNPSGQKTKQVTFNDSNYHPNNSAEGTVSYPLGCNSSSVPGFQASLNFPSAPVFLMAIGTKTKFNVYQENPTGQSNLDVVGQSVISKYSVKPTTANEVVNVNTGSQKKGVLTISAKVLYAYGIAKLTQNNSTSYVPWAFLSGQPELQLTITTPKCS